MFSLAPSSILRIDLTPEDSPAYIQAVEMEYPSTSYNIHIVAFKIEDALDDYVCKYSEKGMLSSLPIDYPSQLSLR